MRIALYHNITSGGTKREAYEFARQLREHGHLVDSYAPITANEEFLPLKQVVNQTFTFDLSLLSDWSGRLPLLRRYVDLTRYLVNLRRLDRLARIIAQRMDESNYDWALVHHDLIVQSPYLLRYLQTPSAYYCPEVNRGIYEPTIIRPNARPLAPSARLQSLWYAPADWMQRQILRYHDRRNLLFAQLHLTNSYFTAESLYRIHGIRARVSYLGVDHKKFHPLNLQRQNFVLSVGAVSPLKGFDFIIASLGLLPPAKRPHLVIIGNTASKSESSYLSDLATKHQVAVEFKVNVSDDQLVRSYNQARAFVYAPILEPFGLAVLEAMACGIPIVAVKEGGIRESVVDGVTGFLTPRDPTLLAQALSRVVDDDALAKRLGSAGRVQVEQVWTWEHAYERLIENLRTAPRTPTAWSN